MNTEKKKTGFAVMDPAKVREIAGKGGRKAHKLGRAHRFSSELAKIAGQKGGISVSQDRAHMAEIGRRGGLKVAADPAHMARIGRMGGEAKLVSNG